MKLPKLDTIIIGVFFICIAMWMVSKCGNRRSDYLQRNTATSDEQEDRPVRRDTVKIPNTPAPTPVTTTPATTPAATTTAPATNIPAPTPTPVKQAAPSSPTQAAQQPKTATATPQQPAAPKQTLLYVTIDQLKMRKEPGLKGKSIAQLDLYEQVYFTGQRTDWTQEISLGLEKVRDKWVKVRTKEGKEGWVFGAGVNYYKEKRKGVLESN